MQNKYLSALKTKYASFGLSREALDRVASQRVKTIANEDEIDSSVASIDTALLVMKEIQGSADAQRSRASQLQKELEDLKTKAPSEPEPPKPESETEKQMKAMMEIVMGIKADMDAGKKKAHNDAILAQVHERMKGSGCTNDYIRDTTLKGIEIGENDTVDSLVERYKPVYDANCKSAFGDGYVPPRSNAQSGDELDFSAMVAGLKASGDLPK